MLVLTRKPGERVLIGGDIVLTVLRVQGDRVRLGFEAPAAVAIRRGEVLRRSPIDPAGDCSAPAAP